jgi:Domain of unknown function (DUF4276)
VKIYVEGGGDSRDLNRACRNGFGKLFEKAGLAGRMPRVVVCGSRAETIKDFSTAAGRVQSGEFVCLLVDSEEPVVENTSPWAVLKCHRPAGTTDENAHLMVECMESWFLAHPEAVERFFGRNFRSNALPKRTDVEKIPKRDVFAALQRASMGQYRKGRLAFELLATLDPDKISASPYAARFFDTLRRKA